MCSPEISLALPRIVILLALVRHDEGEAKRMDALLARSRAQAVAQKKGT